MFLVYVLHCIASTFYFSPALTNSKYKDALDLRKLRSEKKCVLKSAHKDLLNKVLKLGNKNIDDLIKF